MCNPVAISYSQDGVVSSKDLIDLSGMVLLPIDDGVAKKLAQ